MIKFYLWCVVGAVLAIAAGVSVVDHQDLERYGDTYEPYHGDEDLDFEENQGRQGKICEYHRFFRTV